MEQETNERTNSSADQTKSTSGKSAMPYGDALGKVIEGLKGEPLPLFGLGVAIILLGAATLGSESLRTLTIALLILVVVTEVGYVFLKALALQSANAARQVAESGSVLLGDGAKIGENAQVDTGDVETAGGVVKARSGDVKIGRSSAVEKGAAIKSGNVKIGGTESPEKNK